MYPTIRALLAAMLLTACCGLTACVSSFGGGSSPPANVTVQPTY